jgi:hypothetical protein
MSKICGENKLTPALKKTEGGFSYRHSGEQTLPGEQTIGSVPADSLCMLGLGSLVNALYRRVQHRVECVVALLRCQSLT